jgi:thioredoxin 1
METNKKLHLIASASISFVLFLILISPTALAMSNKFTSPEKTSENNVVKITQLKQINTLLYKGPVFVRIGAEWCSVCQSLNPTFEKLAAEYRGKATIAYVDVDQSQDLAKYFKVKSLPDCFVIVGVDNGKYVYMKENCKISTDRSQARIVGRNDNNEKVFEKILNNAFIQ